jgi:cytochrome c-type biogenesis protein CcmH
MINVVLGLVLLLLLALIILVSAVRKASILRIVLPIFMMVISLAMYWQWGAYPALEKLEQQKKQQAFTKEALKQFKGPEDVIKRMELHLKQTPDSAQGWYLLGRLYASQQKIEKANTAFKKAYQIDSKDLKIKFQYMETTYYVNGQKLEGEAKRLLSEILDETPFQLDALNFAASDAYTHKNYSLASYYWQKMLEVLPEGSKEKRVVLDAIANAQTKEGKANDTR